MQNNIKSRQAKENILKKLLIMIIIVVAILLLLKTQILPKMYPKKYSELVEKYATEYELDPLLVYSIIKAESNFKEEAKSNSNAIGLMQIMLETAKEIGQKIDIEEITEEKLLEPDTNINIGTKYFKILLEKYNNEKLAIIAYNAGMGNLDTWLKQGIIDPEGNNLENIPFPETKNYVKKILQNYKIYSEIY